MIWNPRSHEKANKPQVFHMCSRDGIHHACTISVPNLETRMFDSLNTGGPNRGLVEICAFGVRQIGLACNPQSHEVRGWGFVIVTS